MFKFTKKNIFLIYLLYLFCSQWISLEGHPHQYVIYTENLLHYTESELTPQATIHFLTEIGSPCLTTRIAAKELSDKYLIAIECWEEDEQLNTLLDESYFFSFLLSKLQSHLIPETKEEFVQLLRSCFIPQKLKNIIQSALDLHVYWLFFRHFGDEVSEYFPDSWYELENLMRSFRLQSPHAIKESLLLLERYPNLFSSDKVYIVTCKLTLKSSSPLSSSNPYLRYHEVTKCMFQE